MWLISPDGDDWCTFDDEEFETKESAIESAKEWEELEDGFYVGKKVKVCIAPSNVNDILDQIAIDTQKGFEEDYMGGFLQNVKKKHLEELDEKINNIILDWIDKYNYNPKWYWVEEIEFIEIKRKD